MEIKDAVILALVAFLILTVGSSFVYPQTGCTFGNMMYPGGVGGMWFFGWFIMLFVIILIILGIFWLIQQIERSNSKKR